MFESFEKLFKDAPKGSYGTFEVSEEILSAHPQLKALLDELPSGAWIAGSAAMAIHDRVVPPVSREIPKGSFNGDVPLKVTPNLLEYAKTRVAWFALPSKGSTTTAHASAWFRSTSRARKATQFRCR
jgi:hypothetical protein